MLDWSPKKKVEKLENFTFEFEQSDTQIGNGNKNWKFWTIWEALWFESLSKGTRAHELRFVSICEPERLLTETV